MPGTLFVVATPIGNLEDITLRAIRVLGEVDVVAAEDTRRTLKLLNHLEIRRPIVSLREHNEAREGRRLVDRLQAGVNVALVSDAGTPGIADPGMRLVRMARDAGIRVVPVPGASAVTAALSVSGFNDDQFTFAGFPPSGGNARTDWLKSVSTNPHVVVIFEAPHRLERTVADLRKYLGERPILIHHELTKIHESLVICQHTLPDDLPDRGEHVIVLGPMETMRQSVETIVDPKLAFTVAECLTERTGLTDADVIELTARALGVDSRAARKLVKNGRYLVNQLRRSDP